MFQIDPNIVMIAMLIFVRVSAILFALPIFGDTPTPVQVRIMMALAISFCVWPMVPVKLYATINTEPVSLILTVVRELTIGLVIGYVARIAFDGVIMAASVVGYQMGFGTSSMFIPDAGTQMDGFTAFHRILIILIFLGLNLHHIFLTAIFDTFQIIAPGAAWPHSAPLSQLFIDISGQVFTTAIQLAAPVLVSLMFAMAALGLIARAVPQFNVFIMSFPLSFAIGLGIYIATIPFFPEWIQSEFLQTKENIYVAIRGMTP